MTKRTPHEKKEIFAKAYLELNNNATQAAIQAGYSEKSAPQAGSRLLKDEDVKRHLKELRYIRKKRSNAIDKKIAEAPKQIGDDPELFKEIQEISRKMPEDPRTGERIDIVWILNQSVKHYYRCVDDGDNGVAARMIEIVGKHVDIGAFNQETINHTSPTYNILFNNTEIDNLKEKIVESI